MIKLIFMDRIEEILKNRGISKSAFAELIGIKKQNVNALLKNPTRETYERIAKAMNIPMWQLFISPENIMPKSNHTELSCPHCGGPLNIKIE